MGGGALRPRKPAAFAAKRSRLVLKVQCVIYLVIYIYMYIFLLVETEDTG